MTASIPTTSWDVPLGNLRDGHVRGMRWLVALFLLVPGGFLMWASLKALRISGHQMNEDSKHLVSHRRKLYWGVVVCFLAVTTVGTIIGTVLGDSGGSVTGTAAGTAV